jgi:hypothetical protein
LSVSSTVPIVTTARFLLATLVVSGCAFLAPPPVAAGPCTLILVSAGPAGNRQLQPPFIVDLAAPDRMADVHLLGSGWTRVRVTLTDPTGNVRVDDEAPGDEINMGWTGVSVDAPGSWHVRLVDDDAGCTADFSVEVRAATT